MFPGDGPDAPFVIRELLDDPTYREAAERIAPEIRALPPIEHAVELLSRSG